MRMAEESANNMVKSSFAVRDLISFNQLCEFKSVTQLLCDSVHFLKKL